MLDSLVATGQTGQGEGWTGQCLQGDGSAVFAMEALPPVPHPAAKSNPAASSTCLCTFQEELDSTDTSVVISSCSLAEARLLLDNFLKASIDKVCGAGLGCVLSGCQGPVAAA